MSIYIYQSFTIAIVRWTASLLHFHYSHFDECAMWFPVCALSLLKTLLSKYIYRIVSIFRFECESFSFRINLAQVKIGTHFTYSTTIVVARVALSFTNFSLFFVLFMLQNSVEYIYMYFWQFSICNVHR